MKVSVTLPSTHFRFLCAMLGYRKQKVRVISTHTVTFQELNWSGGTKNIYNSFNLDTSEVRSGQFLSAPHPFFNEREGATVQMIPNTAIARTGYFCGKEIQMEIYVHPTNFPALLEKVV